MPSAAQFRLLRAWLGDRSDLCVVGDPDQAIYGFAGADASYLGRLPAVVPAPSGSPTSAWSASAATTGRRRRSSRRPARCSVRPGGVGHGVHAAQPDGPLPDVHRVRHRRRRSARRRTGAARAAESADLPWSRMAVLYRVNAQSALFEEALARARVPFRVRGGGRFLERPEVKVALDHLPQDAHGPRRPVPFVEHLTDLATDAEDARRGAPRARRRARAPRARVPRGRRRHAGASTGSSRSCRPRCAATTPASTPTTRSSCSRSTGPRGSSSTPCSSPASRRGSCRSPTPRPPRRSTRSNASSTSRSAGPSACCT